MTYTQLLSHLTSSSVDDSPQDTAHCWHQASLRRFYETPPQISAHFWHQQTCCLAHKGDKTQHCYSCVIAMTSNAISAIYFCGVSALNGKLVSVQTTKIITHKWRIAKILRKNITKAFYRRSICSADCRSRGSITYASISKHLNVFCLLVFAIQI